MTRRLRGARRGGDIGHAGEEAADGDGVGRVVGALVDHLQRVVAADDGGRHLDAAGAPAVGQRHLAPAERHLVARDRHRLQDGAADHPLGLLVEIGEVVSAVVAVGCYSAAWLSAACRLRASTSARSARTISSSRLEIDVVRQLEMLHEARGLDVVGVRQHELLVLRRRGGGFSTVPRRAAPGRPAPWPSPCARRGRRPGHSRG